MGLAACLVSCSAPETVAPDPLRRLEVATVIDGAQRDLVPIGWLAVSPGGRLAVAQQQDGIVRLFDTAGTALGQAGRTGDGPGEFREISSGGWLGDSLWIIDGLLRRLTILGATGALVRSVALPMPDSAGARVAIPGLVTYSAAGFAAGDTVIGYVPAGGAREASGLDPRRATLVLMTLQGITSGVITQLGEDRSRVPIVAEGFSPGSVMRTPFHAIPLWALSAGGAPRRLQRHGSSTSGRAST